MASPIKNSNQGGKRPGQKYKSLLVWQYLLKHTDKDHAASSKAIEEHLDEYGITADRHSIARDIAALNELFAVDADADIDERDHLSYEIVYDTKLHGYKVAYRPYSFQDVRLLAESVRSARFISNMQEKTLLAAIEDMCSEDQVKELENDVYMVVGRTKTDNECVMDSIGKIYQAIREKKKIEFIYLKYRVNDRSTRVARRGGKPYVFSPYKLLINEGNYYLLACGSKAGEVYTFRVDRMKGVEVLAERREHEDTFASVNLSDYTRRVFSMFGGDTKRVRIRFDKKLLDTVVDRFGSESGVAYSSDGEGNFIVSADIAISDTFFSWVCGFRERATIVGPEDVKEEFRAFLKDISSKYETE